MGDKATRYSGALKVRMRYVDGPGNGYYRVVVSGNGHSWKGVVGAPRFLSTAVDSVRAYDEVASAALSFAERDMGSIADLAAFKRSGEGFYVTAKKSHAYGFAGRKNGEPLRRIVRRMGRR